MLMKEKANISTNDDLIKNLQETITLLSQRLKETEKKLAEALQRSEYLEHIIDVLPGNVYWSDKNHVLMGVSNSLVKISGLPSKDHIIGKTNYELPWSNLASEYNRVNQQVIDTRETVITEENLDIDGFKTYITIKAPLLDKQNNLMGVVGISYDITERKQQELELKKAKEMAEIANRTKTDFIMNISHDLRTPFSGIIGLSEYLEHTETEATKREILKDITTSGQKVLLLINNIIELIKTDSHEIIPQSEFSLATLIEEIIDLVKVKIREKNLHLTIDIDPLIPTSIISKKEILNRVLLNLISNAIKFTSQGTIGISVDVINRSTERVIIKLNVSDTGIGIPEDKKDLIFEKFTRLNPSYEGNYQGSGLGLWLVKNAIEQIHGTISIESKINKGSTFSCVFECEIGKYLNCDTQLTTPVKKIKADSERLFSILIVEDDLIASKAAKLLLSKYFNCFITHTENASKALEVIKKHTYDLILLDIGLPDISGAEIAKLIKQFITNKTIVIGLTAHAKSDLTENEQQAFNYVIEKPLNLDLCEFIENVLR